MIEFITSTQPFDPILSTIMALLCLTALVLVAKVMITRWNAILLGQLDGVDSVETAMFNMCRWYRRTFRAGALIKFGSTNIHRAVFMWSCMIPILAWSVLGARYFGDFHQTATSHPVFWQRTINIVSSIALAALTYTLYKREDAIKLWLKVKFGRLIPRSSFLSYLAYLVCYLIASVCILGPFLILLLANFVDFTLPPSGVPISLSFTLSLLLTATVFPPVFFMLFGLVFWIATAVSDIGLPVFLLILPISMEIATTVSAKFTHGRVKRFITGPTRDIKRPYDMIKTITPSFGVALFSVIWLWVLFFSFLSVLDIIFPRNPSFDWVQYLRDVANGQSHEVYLLFFGSLLPLVPPLMVTYSGLFALFTQERPKVATGMALAVSGAILLCLYIGLWGLLQCVGLLL